VKTRAKLGNGVRNSRPATSSSVRAKALRRSAAGLCAARHALPNPFMRERRRMGHVGLDPEPELRPHPGRIVRRLARLQGLLVHALETPEQVLDARPRLGHLGVEAGGWRVLSAGRGGSKKDVSQASW
jgi:hypothetical protein